ncbi:MAG: hypothetical protein WBD36_00780, partial [Bacteroidota bacterium]
MKSHLSLILNLNLILILLFFLLLSSCRKEEPCATCPPPTNGPDTTSHEFTWHIDTLGGAQSSAFYDVAIINDTLAYAVGEVYLNDSFGQLDPQPYGLAIWNGKGWTAKKVAYHDFGSTSLLPGSLNAVYAFGPNDVFVCSSANLLHWDGNSWTEKVFFMTGIPFNGQVLRMWGTSNTMLFCVGRGGAIYTYIGTSWQKLASGTTLDVQDIWGDGGEILAVASKPFVNYEKMVLSISGSTVTALSDSGIDEPVSCLWFSSAHHYYAAGSGIYEKSDLAESQWKNGPLDIAHYFVYGMRANRPNDIVAVGGYGEVLHYNGATWKSFHADVGLVAGNYYGVAMKNNLVIAVGADAVHA